MSSAELWSVQDVAREYGMTYSAAYQALRRSGAQPAAFGPRGVLLYDPAVVGAALAALPGQGRRSDLRRGETDDPEDDSEGAR